MTADLTTRITEALDQAERLARAATRFYPSPWVLGTDQVIDDEGDTVVVADRDIVALIAATADPASVLRSVAADRRVLERHWLDVQGDLCGTCYNDAGGSYVPWPCPEITDLADRWGVDVTNEGNGS